MGKSYSSISPDIQTKFVQEISQEENDLITEYQEAYKVRYKKHISKPNVVRQILFDQQELIRDQISNLKNGKPD